MMMAVAEGVVAMDEGWDQKAHGEMKDLTLISRRDLTLVVRRDLTLVDGEEERESRLKP